MEREIYYRIKMSTADIRHLQCLQDRGGLTIEAAVEAMYPSINERVWQIDDCYIIVYK